ncbi:YcaO-like family protein [Paenibacillus sp. MMS20-IR301]|uniref:YcaO-like family protein n=1 Tax=Paenibacillus sp. MMS20-IR301 TaxID=2895946 RepID=UPI0028E4D085|nr:YcaO-like family protein [Paenibacillus sp. MMS20-IR301]WNS43481.1 YcaO-like family protein [Paenibacillus sp. MMS20-IR301]
MINLIRNDSAAFMHMKTLLSQEQIPYRIADCFEASTVLYVTDVLGDYLEETTNRVMSIFYFENLLMMGPFNSQHDPGKLSAAIIEMRNQGLKNLPVILFGKKIPFRADEASDSFLVNFIKAFDQKEELLHEYSDSLFVLSWKHNEFLRYKLIDKKPKAAADLKQNHNDDQRVHKIGYYDHLYDTYTANSGGVFIHRYLDLMSKHIPAFGTQLKVSSNYTESGYGRGYSRAIAKTLSTVEAFERYAGMFNKTDAETVCSTYRQIKDQALDPRKLILHSEEEYSNPNFKLKRYDDNLKFNWIRATSLKNGKEVFIPEQAVFFGSKEKKEKENYFLYETSNGAAVGGSIKEAILYGLYEVIERHNFLSTWYSRAKCTEIALESAGIKEINNLNVLLKRDNKEIKLYDISADLGIPSIWALVRSKDQNAVMAAYNAAGTNLSPVKAAESALLEVCTSYPIYEYLLRHDSKIMDRAKYVIQSAERVTEFQDHVLYYSSSRNSKYLQFADNGESAKDIRDVYKNAGEPSSKGTEEYLRIVLAKLLSCFEDVLYLDITPDFLRNEELFCVKIIVPGMLPMTFGQQYKRTIYATHKEPHPFP